MNMSHSVLIAAACIALATPCSAQETPSGPDRAAIVLHDVDLHPATSVAARRTFARIDAAALDVCGFDSSSLREAIASERKAACWQVAMAAAMSGIDDPRLLTAYRHSR